MATAAEGLPEADAQPAKRKGPGGRGRVRSLTVWPLVGCQAAACARPREGQAGWAGGWRDCSPPPSVRLLAGGEVAVPLQAAAGPPETWSLCFQAGGKADAVTTLRGSCAGSARSSPGAGCGGAGFCEKCSGCRFLWLEIWFRSL